MCLNYKSPFQSPELDMIVKPWALFMSRKVYGEIIPNYRGMYPKCKLGSAAVGGGVSKKFLFERSVRGGGRGGEARQVNFFFFKKKKIMD